MLAVDLVCVGDVDAEVLDFVMAGVAREIEAEVTPAGTVPIPPETYDAERRQYSSSRVLERLSGKARRLGLGCPDGEAVAPGTVLLAVTSVDLYVPELNFVFGEALPAERACIISLARLGTSREGKPVPREVMNERALKEAVHEIGHLLGLGHCSRRDCVMFFSNSILDTDRKGHELCAACRRTLSD